MLTPAQETFLAALRSGEFIQGTDALRTSYSDQDNKKDEYCCLGVACEIYSRITGHGKWVREESKWAFSAPGSPFMRYVMPNAVAEFLGLSATGDFVDPVLVPSNPPQQNTASDLNDLGSSFDDIADWFEELFKRANAGEAVEFITNADEAVEFVSG